MSIIRIRKITLSLYFISREDLALDGVETEMAEMKTESLDHWSLKKPNLGLYTEMALRTQSKDYSGYTLKSNFILKALSLMGNIFSVKFFWDRNTTSHIKKRFFILIRVVYKHLDCRSAAFALRAHAGQIMNSSKITF